MKTRIRRLTTAAGSRIALAFGLRQSDDTLIHDAQRYWSDADSDHFRAFSHWKGEDGLAEDTWYVLGEIHLEMFEEVVRLTGLPVPCERIVEWGCGGGANAIHFAGVTRQFVGVDVSQASLDECDKTLREAGHQNFLPVLIEVALPEAALDLISGPCDFFLCTYVFELIPSPEYGRRLVNIALQLLRPGGIALIQIKYATHARRTRSRRWGYRYNVAHMTTYPVEEFWELAQEEGFTPRYVILHPKQLLVHDERYAYFVLERVA